MKFDEMTVEELETRQAEIAGMETEGVATEEIEQRALDLEAIKAELETRKQKAAEEAETRKKIADGMIGETKEEHQEEKKMDVNEIRSSKAYVDAFANYLVNGDDKECRALLTENAANNGQLPVPVIVDGIIRTAWEEDAILSRVRKTNFRGNVKVAFERAADPAYEHGEGTTAITEEDLTLGVVTMIPKMIKKYVRISDEIVAMGGEALVSYVYTELAHQIIKLLSSLVIGDIKGASTSHSSSAIGIPKIAGTPSLTIVPEAEANLTDEAKNVVVIINRLTSAAFNEARVAGNFAVDPYDGLTVLYTSALPAYSTADSDAVWMIVGDLDGAQVNYPEGEGVITKWDDLSEAEADMVKVHGRQYAAHGVTGPGRFVNVKKSGGSTTTT
jgi:HK97 family phage major capsid protein